MSFFPSMKPFPFLLSCFLGLFPSIICGQNIQGSSSESTRSTTMTVVKKDSLQQGSSVKQSPLNRRRRALQKESDKGVGSLSQRQRQFNDRLRQDTKNAPWKRIVYRQIDLDSANNAVLYYPPRPTSTDQNLFTILFKEINKGELKAYEYTDGVEVFDDRTEIKFGEFLDRFGIYSTQVAGEGASSYHVEDADIPSDLVKSYYLKEEYYFDPINSTTSKRVVALCPIFYDDLSGEQLRFPLFWVRYDDIRPYINAKMVMLSDLNNAESLTLDGFFRLGLYKGIIYKTLNLRGRTLAQYCPTPDSLKNEQQRIEKELQSFESSLWSRAARESKATDEMTSSVPDNATKVGSKEADTARARRSQAKEKRAPKRAKAPKQKKNNAVKSSSSGGRSARSRF